MAFLLISNPCALSATRWLMLRDTSSDGVVAHIDEM